MLSVFLIDAGMEGSGCACCAQSPDSAEPSALSLPQGNTVASFMRAIADTLAPSEYMGDSEVNGLLRIVAPVAVGNEAMATASTAVCPLAS